MGLQRVGQNWMTFTYLVVVRLLSRRRHWHPTPVLLPGKSHGRRGLVGCSPWGREESDTTERLHFHSSLSCIGEGNGSPLQRSCLENPKDGGAWWGAVCGVAQSRTWLKQLSSSSSSKTLCDPMDWSLPGSSVHGDSPGKNTGMGCPALLQGIFPTQGLNLNLLHCRHVHYRMSHQGSLFSTMYKIESFVITLKI